MKTEKEIEQMLLDLKVDLVDADGFSSFADDDLYNRNEGKKAAIEWVLNKRNVYLLQPDDEYKDRSVKKVVNDV